MASQTNFKLSILAQYDDMCRYTNMLTSGCEEEFKVFIENQLNVTRKLNNSESEIRRMKEKISSLEKEKQKHETQMKHLRNVIEVEVNKRKQVEKEKDSMERQLALIKDVLLADSNNLDNQTKEKLAFLNSTNFTNKLLQPPGLATIEESVGSFLSASSDTTEDGLDEDESRISCRRSRRYKGRRSNSEGSISPKRKKLEPDQEQTEVKRFSEPAGNTPNRPLNIHVHRSDSDQLKVNTYDFRRLNTGTLPSGTPVGRYSTGGKLSRSHVFATKTVIRTERCYPCGRNIGFCKQALKCQDCRMTCHIECEDRCPVPCVPAANTPTKGSMGTISDYVSTNAPKIPALIVHCINEIEMRGLREIGLYRISGSEREVKELKEKFLKGRTVPYMNQIDIHAICGTVKEFLRSLSEPLIPKSAWQTFVEAAEIKNEAMSLKVLNQAIMDLPQANRDTLAFLILHLQRVAVSKDCKMPIENLSKVFGPTIVGYSSSEPTDVNMLRETQYQHKVMHCLLKLSCDFWEKLLNIEPDVFLSTTPMKTPEAIPAPASMSRLGPIYAGKKTRSSTLTRTPLTPRNTKFSKSGKTHFSSPLLK